MNIVNLNFEVYEDASSPASPSENYAYDASRCTRSFQVYDATPARRYAFAKAMLGYSKVVPDGGRRYLSRQIPFGNPAVSDPDLNAAGAEYLWCKSVPSGSPILSEPSADPATGAATYKGYRFSCEFRTLPYRVCVDDDVLLLAQDGPLKAAPGLNARPDEGDALRRGLANTRYVTRSITPGVKLGQIKGAALRFLYDPGPGPAVPQGIPYRHFKANVVYTWYEVPLEDLPWSAMDACFEGVNLGTFDRWDEGTLLLASAAVRQYASPLSATLYADVEYHMEFLPNKENRLTGGVHRQLGHNSILAHIKPENGGTGLDYYPVTDTGTPESAGGKTPFPYVDFSALFRPTQP